MILHTTKPELVEQIAWLIPHLPPVRPVPVRGEADYYGASLEIALANGLGSAPLSTATWRHGWTPMALSSAEAIATYKPSSRVHLMPDSRHADFLRNAGYPNAFPVGMPILYARGGEVARRRGTLLMAPFHSLPEITPPDEQKANEESMAAYLLGLKERFSCVCACLHANCVESRLWTDTFDERGIPWVVGAKVDDGNALWRIKTLFGAFECVASNQMGSAIAYAAFCGARTTVCGPLAEPPSVESLSQHPHYRKHPDQLRNLEQLHPDRLRGLYPFLFVDPHEASGARDWAQRELGSEHLLRHEDIARLLGWRWVDGDPVWEGFDRRKAVATLGWLPSSIGSVEVVDKVAKMLEREGMSGAAGLARLSEQRRAARQLPKIKRTAERTGEELRAIKGSLAWRWLARPLYSLEKRLRPGLRGGQAVADLNGEKEGADEAGA